MQEFRLTDKIVTELTEKLIGKPMVGAPSGFSAITDIDHLGEEAIFVTLDFPIHGKALEADQFQAAHAIVDDALADCANGRWIYLRLNYPKRLVA